jgi:hypothetical protein
MYTANEINALKNRAKAIAAMGLVGKVNDGYNVISPGFRKEVFRVWKNEEGKVRCSCVTFQEKIAQDLRYKCEHIMAVKYHLDENGAAALKEESRDAGEVVAFACRQTEPVSKFPKEPVSKTMAELVTPRQLVAIRAIANSQRIDAEAECKRVMSCKPEELSRKAASALIDHLKSLDTEGAVNDSKAAEVLKKFTEAIHAKHNGLHELANRTFYEAQKLWQRWGEDTGGLHKPQPKSNGTYNGIEY